MMQGGRRGVRYRAILACFLLLTLVPTARALAPASAAVTDPYPDRDGFFGVVGRDPYYEWNTDTVHFNNDVNKTVLENMVKEMAASGVKWVRVEFFAEYGDPTGPGRMPYEKYDWFLTDLMRRYNMNVLGLLSYGIVRDTNYTYILNKVNDPADRGDGSNPFIRGFVDRATEIAGHYAGYVNAWEIINEPNQNSQLDFITKGQQQRIFADRMASIMSLVYPRLKGIKSDVPVVLGGLINTAGAYPDNYDIPYLRQLYGSTIVRGHGAPWDVVADHPYELNAADIPGHVRQMHTVMEQAGEGNKKIWVTEFGTQAAAPPVPESGIIPVTPDEAQQAAFLNDTLTGLLAMRDIVERAFWFKLEDFTIKEQGDKQTNWGLFAFQRDGKNPGEPWPRKDALRAYATLARPAALPTAPEDPNEANRAGRQVVPGHEALAGRSVPALLGTERRCRTVRAAAHRRLYIRRQGGADLRARPVRVPRRIRRDAERSAADATRQCDDAHAHIRHRAAPAIRFGRLLPLARCAETAATDPDTLADAEADPRADVSERDTRREDTDAGQRASDAAATAALLRHVLHRDAAYAHRPLPPVLEARRRATRLRLPDQRADHREECR